MITELHCAEITSKIADVVLSSPVVLSDLCALFHAPKCSLPNAPQWNNCLSAVVNIMQHTANNENVQPWALAWCSHMYIAKQGCQVM
jgi:hypothetical protein